MFTIRVFLSSVFTFFFFLAISDAKAIFPRNANGDCNVSGQHCCNTVMSKQDAATQNAPGSILSILIPDLDGDVGIDCSPLGILGLGLQSTCKASPVCCSGGSTYNGFINFGCSPINIL